MRRLSNVEIAAAPDERLMGEVKLSDQYIKEHDGDDRPFAWMGFVLILVSLFVEGAAFTVTAGILGAASFAIAGFFLAKEVRAIEYSIQLYNELDSRVSRGIKKADIKKEDK